MTTENTLNTAEATVTETAKSQPKKAKAAKANSIPSVLAFARSFNPGHMPMFSASSERPARAPTPVLVRLEPLRGLNATLKTEDDKKNEAVLQVVESANLAADDDTLVLRGKLLVRNNVRTPFSCNDSNFVELQEELVKHAVQDGLHLTLATRYAINLLSGSWGWRNALESESVAVTVKWYEGEDPKSVTVNNLILNATDRFNVASYPAHADAIEKLSAAIARALSGETRGYLFRLEGRFVMGECARVYPSQEWASEPVKKASKKDWGGDGSSGVTRILAKVLNSNGDLQAIINDRKAGNALRVVDTWYSSEGNAAPIAAEVFGANSHQGVALRTGKNASSFFDILGKVVARQPLTPEETLYYLSVCIRGGVLGGKEEKEGKSEA